MARAATAAPGMSLKSHLKFSSQSLLNALAERERDRERERGRGRAVAKHSAKNAPNLREQQSYVKDVMFKCSTCAIEY